MHPKDIMEHMAKAAHMKAQPKEDDDGDYREAAQNTIGNKMHKMKTEDKSQKQKVLPVK